MSRPETLVLHQFAFSHYNEKVRWALDYKGVARQDRVLLPGFHASAVRRLSGGPTTTPLLEEAGRGLSGSAAILRRLEVLHPTPRLFPRDEAARAEVDDWVRWLDDEVGPAVRLALFHELLAAPGYAARIFTTGRSGWKASAYRRVFPALVPMLRSRMSVDEAGAIAARETIEAAGDRVAQAAATTGYLVGAGFTAADLTAGSLLFPLFFPSQLAFSLPEPRVPEIESWLARWRGAAAEPYVLGLFEKHRQAELPEGTAGSALRGAGRELALERAAVHAEQARGA